MWEEEEECSYTKATPECRGEERRMKGRMDSSTEPPLIRLSLRVLPVRGWRGMCRIRMIVIKKNKKKD